MDHAMVCNGAAAMPINDTPNPYAAFFSNCIKAKNIKLGRALHSHLIKTASILDTFCTNRLVQIYSKCGSVDCARKAFEDLPFKNPRSWNTMISTYSQMGRPEMALQLFDQMAEPNVVTFGSIISGLSKSGFYAEAINAFRGIQRSSRSIAMDAFVVVGLTNALGNLAALKVLRQVHGVAIATGLDFDAVVCNALISAYGKCGMPESSYQIFNRMERKDVVSWTSIVTAYMGASRMGDACRMFDEMPVRNEVSWTALITGLVQNEEGERALFYFKKMQDEGVVVANDVTYVGVLSACADLALVGSGKQIHGRIIRVKSAAIFENVFIVNTLIDMYSKCGDMISAVKLFNALTIKDTVTWNSIINGFAQTGRGEDSLAAFEKMLQAGQNPNDVTFIGVLSACSHSGLDSEGLRFYNMMKNKFGLTPKTDHYVILVDLLGRKNRLVEALNVIEKAPDGSGRVGMWGALLAACRVHGNLELGVRAGEALFELEPENTGRYVMLANVYATAGKWDDARRIRMLMEGRELKKEAGYSWIEVKNGRRCAFVAKGIGQCDEVEDVQRVSLNLVNQMKNYGWMEFDNQSVLL